MSVHNNGNVAVKRIVARLTEISDLERFATIPTSNYAESLQAVRKIVSDIMMDSDFCYFHGVYYLFMGEIYEPIDMDVVSKGIEEWLVVMRVRANLLQYSFNRILNEALRSIRINRPFTPVFHIKAYQNGVVDFTDGVLHPFSSKFHVMYKNPYRYEPSAKCPMWKTFLRTVLPEKESRMILQMYLGLCTYDRGKMVDKIENCLMLYGTGANGKSVIYETIVGIFGRENVSSMGLMSLIRGGDERLRNMAKIDGKIINMCPEIQARDISGYEDAFKTLISGEKQYARHIGGNVYEVVNVPWMMFNMNHIPTASDTSHGYFRRMLYLIFDTVIPEEMQNKHLADDLRNEYSGILNWIVRGGRYLKQNRFVFPQSCNSERQKLIEMGKKNPVMSWARARDVRPSPNTKGERSEWIKVSDLYDDMARYVRKNEFEENMPANETVFGRFMTRIGFGKLSRKKSSTGILYRVYGVTTEELKKKNPPLIDELYMAEDRNERMYDFIDPDDF